MSRPAKITILCEDLQTATFIRYFFMQRGWRDHDFRVLPLPAGKKSGEQYVREELPNQLKAYRSKCNHISSIALVVAIDADTLTVSERKRQLEQVCCDEGITPPGNNERILLVVPKRNIETWRAYLQGNVVNESVQYPKHRGCESECMPEAQHLHDMCQCNEMNPMPSPLSLDICCRDFNQFWSLLKTKNNK